MALLMSIGPKRCGQALFVLLYGAIVLLLPILPLLWPVLRFRRRRLLSGPFGGLLQRQESQEKKRNHDGKILRLSFGETFVRVSVPPADAASGAPTLVLVHGNVGSTSYLDELAECLTAQGRRVLRYDLYGRGWSACGGFAHTRQLFVSQLAEVLLATRATADGPIDLVGYSIGGQLAGLFAATYPQLVRQLVLLLPAVVIPSWIPTIAQLPTVRWLAGHAMRLSLQDKLTYAGDWLHTHATSSASREEKETSFARLDALHETEADRYRNEPHIARTFGLSLAGLPFDDDAGADAEWRRLGRSTVEIHVVCAALDTVASGPPAAAWLSERLSGGEALRSLQVLEGMGHSLPYEFPERCCELLLSLLGGAGVGTGGGGAIARGGRASSRAARSPARRAP